MQAGVAVQLREVVLRDKPEALRDVSPKATVPVLVLPDGQVLEEPVSIFCNGRSPAVSRGVGGPQTHPVCASWWPATMANSNAIWMAINTLTAT